MLLLGLAGCCLILVVNGFYLDSECSSDADCNSTNSFCSKLSGCTNGLCHCKAGYGPSGSTTTCKQYVYKELGQNCSYSSLDHCNPKVEGLTCSGGKCACGTGLTKSGSTCLWAKSLALDEACTIDVDCVVYRDQNRGGSCIGSKCKCINGYTASGSTCLLDCPSAHTPRGYFCVSDTATEVGKGEACDQHPYTPGSTIPANTKYCGSATFCYGCPEKESDLKCRSRATTAILAPALLLICALAMRLNY